ncbi:MAG: carbonic anhydrase [Dehalococcoidia bacterium]
MAEDAGQLEALEPADISAGSDSAVSIARKAEGGLALQFSFDIPKIPSVAKVNTWTHQQLINGGLMLAVALLVAWIVYQEKFAPGEVTALPASVETKVEENLRPNVATSFNPDIESPVVGAGSYVDKLASVIGNVSVGKGVFVAPFASIRGDEGQPIVIGDGSNIQDGVVIHALETVEGGEAIEQNLVTVGARKYAVYIGKNVSLAHQSQVHGPAAVGDNTFVGMQVLVFKATIGKNVVIEPGARVIGVNVPAERYVPAGSVITTQAQADALPEITAGYAFATLNDGVLHVNQSLADAYLKLADIGAGSGEGSEAAAASGH